MICSHCQKHPASYTHTSKKNDKSLFICELCLNTKYCKIRIYELRRIDGDPLDMHKFKMHRRRNRIVYKLIPVCSKLHIFRIKYKQKFCTTCLSWFCEMHMPHHLTCDDCNKCYNLGSFDKSTSCRNLCDGWVCRNCLHDNVCKKCTLAPLKYFMSSRRSWIQTAKATGMFDKNICYIIVSLLFQRGYKSPNRVAFSKNPNDTYDILFPALGS